MKPKHISARYAHFDDGTGWPLPERNNEDDESLQWKLRYGRPTKAELLHVASVMSAYEALIALPQKRRQEVVRAIRQAAGKCT